MTVYLDVQHLTKWFGERLLFEDVSFSIAKGQHVALIARNGTGKTTLLNILAGKEDYDEGSVVYHRDISVAYLEQNPQFDPEVSVIDACLLHTGELAELIAEYERRLALNDESVNELLEEMDRRGAWSFEHEAKEVLSKLKITDFDRKMGNLSGGEAKRVALANCLLAEPDLMILDEPTNHLDLGMTEWLEKYLSRSNKAILMVTHDRYMLDAVCTQIIELDGQTIFSYPGDYERYLERRADRMSAADASMARANNRYRRELEWMRRMPKARGGKAKYRKDAFAELEQKVKQRHEEQNARLEMKATYIGAKIFEAQYVSKSFQNGEAAPTVILKDFYYNFSRYEKMGIVGDNGSGKSTFVKLLLGELQPDEGRFVIGETVKFGYYSQEGLPLDKDMKVIDAVRQIAETVDLGGGKRISAMQFLNHFLFPPKKQQDYIYKLSGGERRRLQLCMVLMKAPNFLILDEPTNDLDIATLQILEEFLIDFKGCVIVVSHDRYFTDRVVDHLLVFKGNGIIKDFPGNYTQYRQWQNHQNDTEKQEKTRQPNSKPKEIVSERPRKRKMTFNEKREFEQLEKDIENLEAEKSEIETALCSGTLSVEELTQLSKRLPELNEELDEKSMRWLELSEI